MHLMITLNRNKPSLKYLNIKKDDCQFTFFQVTHIEYRQIGALNDDCQFAFFQVTHIVGALNDAGSNFTFQSNVNY